MKEGTTKQAVEYILEHNIISKYRMAKLLGVEPIMIFKYLKGSRMRKGTARTFTAIFGIAITDIYGNSNEAISKTD